MNYVTQNSRKISHKFVMKRLDELEVGDLIFEAKSGHRMEFVGQYFGKNEYDNPTLSDEYKIMNNLTGKMHHYQTPGRVVHVLTLSQ